MHVPPHMLSGRRSPLPMTGRLSWLLAIVGTLAGWYSIATAETFYQWTDDRGVVHFADLPPAQSKGVEERHLAVPPAVRQEPQEAAESAGSAGTNAQVAGGPASQTPAAEGPARVIVILRQAPRIGPSAMHLTGEVKNVGGRDAQQVIVSLSVVDATQGTPCLQDEAPVAPSTLRPGEKGNFDTNVDSPCLYGDTDIDVTPVWE